MVPYKIGKLGKKYSKEQIQKRFIPMCISEDISFDETIVGSAQNIKDMTFVPVYDVYFGSVELMGTLFTVSISPKAFIVIDKQGEIALLKLDKDMSFEDFQ